MPGNHYTKISFYIVAHADDWQLFMCPNVYKDLITPNSKIVFIISTAGDAGFNENFWAAREEGAKSSLRFCLAPKKNLLQLEGIKLFNEHKIYSWSVANATIYFLRLPDGGLNGNGFSACNFQCLSKLKTSEITSISAVDNSTTYCSWSDFYTTLASIIHSESDGIAEESINYINPDVVLNPNDHPDHIATGQSIQCIHSIEKMQQVLYVGYSTCEQVGKLNSTDFFWKAGMFAAYEKAVFDNSGYSTLKEDVNIYIKWCSSSADFIIKQP